MFLINAYGSLIGPFIDWLIRGSSKVEECRSIWVDLRSYSVHTLLVHNTDQ